MASQVLSEFQVESSEYVLPGDAISGPIWAPSAFEVPSLATPLESCAEDGSCVKGFFVAIGLETAMALGLYGIWQAWHILR